jgi:hypothetical protein
LPPDDAGSETPRLEIRVDRWTAEEKRLRVAAPSRARLALRVLNYPAWHVEVNGRPTQPEHGNGVQQMVLPVDAGVSDIDVRFARTADRTAGGAVSALSAFVVVFLLRRAKSRDQRRSIDG